jgi:hypothetical protein
MPTIFGPAAEGTENILIALLSVTGFSIVARSTSNLVRIHKLFLEDCELDTLLGRREIN